MQHKTFEPRIAVREEKRQANEALGSSFYKTLTELITNSDSSYKRKYKLPHSSGLIELMFQTPKGTQLDTSSMRTRLTDKFPQRTITIEVVTAKSTGRTPNEIVIIDEAEGMSTLALKTALSDIGGDRIDLHGAAVGRNLFGRGLSDVMRAHHKDAVISDLRWQSAHHRARIVAQGRWAMEN